MLLGPEAAPGQGSLSSRPEAPVIVTIGFNKKLPSSCCSSWTSRPPSTRSASMFKADHLAGLVGPAWGTIFSSCNGPRSGSSTARRSSTVNTRGSFIDAPGNKGFLTELSKSGFYSILGAETLGAELAVFPEEGWPSPLFSPFRGAAVHHRVRVRLPGARYGWQTTTITPRARPLSRCSASWRRTAPGRRPRRPRWRWTRSLRAYSSRSLSRSGADRARPPERPRTRCCPRGRRATRAVRPGREGLGSPGG